MPNLVDPTELLAVDPEAAHYVRKPANGFSPLLAKAENEVEEVLTVAGAAALAAKRNGERIFKDGGSGTGREQHDSPTYQANSTPPFPESDQDKPNSSVANSGAMNRPGFGNPEVDALLCKAEEIVDQALTLTDLIEKAGWMKYEDFLKGKYSADEMKKLLAEGKAFRNANGDPSYPIADTSDLSKAIKAVGRGGSSHDAIRKYVIRRAKSLGKADMIPENWSSSGSMKKDSPLYMVMDPATGETSIPGSPEWEAEDAQRLIAIGQQLAQTITAVQASANRESIEVNAGAADDQQDVWMLQDACCALEAALGIVSRLAFHEEAEAGSNPPEGALAKSLTESSVDAIRRTLFLAKAADADNPAPQGSGLQEEVWDMGSLTKEDLAGIVGEAVKPISDRIDAFEEKLAKGEIAPAAAPDADAAATAEAEKLAKEASDKQAADEKFVKDLMEWDAAVKAAERPAQSNEELGALLKGVVEEAVAPLNERLTKVEATAAPGGLMSGAGGAGLPAGPRDANSADDPTVTGEMKDLQGKIQKAEADGDVIASERFRKALGQRVLEVAWAGMGYPTATPATRQAQYTENAPSAMAR